MTPSRHLHIAYINNGNLIDTRIKITTLIGNQILVKCAEIDTLPYVVLNKKNSNFNNRDTMTLSQKYWIVSKTSDKGTVVKDTF